MSLFKKSAVPRLSLGKVLITQAASDALDSPKEEGVPLLYRHLHGDWGDVTEQDALQNEIALVLGMRVWSSYRLPTGKTIWIITAASRSETIILLADSDQVAVRGG
ncbi:hypothetical protein [Bordetella petrii]|uniref:hypothetical protein n=1 Tax=Bordetella petrii TaxID=94624 RepID=UPI001A95AA8C|nr:hypothetical protein [Bordetella petrii]MBO1111835.1 hypothetical protein [Bordetella petrii]